MAILIANRDRERPDGAQQQLAEAGHDIEAAAADSPAYSTISIHDHEYNCRNNNLRLNGNINVSTASNSIVVNTTRSYTIITANNGDPVASLEEDDRKEHRIHFHCSQTMQPNISHLPYRNIVKMED